MIFLLKDAAKAPLPIDKGVVARVRHERDWGHNDHLANC